MSTHAIAIVHEEARVYGISIPDLPGCIAAGDNLDEALRRGAAAATAYVDSSLDVRERLPMLRTLDQLKADPTFRNDAVDGLIVALPVDFPGEAVRVNASLDENLIAAIGRAAARAGLSRQDFLAAVAKAKLEG